MAKLPRFLAGTPPPRESGLARATDIGALTRTGEAAVWAGVSRIGQAMQYGARLGAAVVEEKRGIDAKQDYDTVTSNAKDFINKQQLDVEDNQVVIDEKAQARIMQEKEVELGNFLTEQMADVSPRARKMIDAWKLKALPAYRNHMRRVTSKKWRDYKVAVEDEFIDAHIAEGDFAAANDRIEVMEGNGLIDHAMALEKFAYVEKEKILKQINFAGATLLEDDIEAASKLIEESKIYNTETEKAWFRDKLKRVVNNARTQKQLIQEQRDDEIGEKFLALLTNKLDPTKPQLEFDAIVVSDLSFDAKEKWFAKLRVFDNYSEQELKEAFTDKGEVLADIYDRIDNNKITDDEIRDIVGKGLSPDKAQDIISERREPFEKDTEQLFKRIFGWTPELGFGEKKFAPFAYEKTLREWQAEIKRQDATGEKIIEIGRSIARPYLLEHLQMEMPSDVDIPRMMELALGEETEKLETPKPIEAEEPRREPSEPMTSDDFVSEVTRLKGIDREKAKEYYDTWIGKFKKEE